MKRKLNLILLSFMFFISLFTFSNSTDKSAEQKQNTIKVPAIKLNANFSSTIWLLKGSDEVDLSKPIKDQFALTEEELTNKILTHNASRVVYFVLDGALSEIVLTDEEFSETNPDWEIPEIISEVNWLDNLFLILKREIRVVKNFFPKINSNLYPTSINVNDGLTEALLTNKSKVFSSPAFSQNPQNFLNLSQNANIHVYTFPLEEEKFDPFNPIPKPGFSLYEKFYHKVYSTAFNTLKNFAMEMLQTHSLPANDKVYIGMVPTYVSTDPLINNKPATLITPFWLEYTTKTINPFTDFKFNNNLKKVKVPYYYEIPEEEFMPQGANVVKIKKTTHKHIYSSVLQNDPEILLSQMVDLLASKVYDYHGEYELSAFPSCLPVKVINPTSTSTKAALFLDPDDNFNPAFFPNDKDLKKAKDKYKDFIKRDWLKNHFTGFGDSNFEISTNKFIKKQDEKHLILTNDKFLENLDYLFPEGKNYFKVNKNSFTYELKADKTKSETLSLAPSGTTLTYEFVSFSSSAAAYQKNVKGKFIITILPETNNNAFKPRLFSSPEEDGLASIGEDAPLIRELDYEIVIPGKSFTFVEIFFKKNKSDTFTRRFISPFYDSSLEINYDTYFLLKPNHFSLITNRQIVFGEHGIYQIRLSNLSGAKSKTYYFAIAEEIKKPLVKTITQDIPNGSGGVIQTVKSVELTLFKPLDPNFYKDLKLYRDGILVNEDANGLSVSTYGKFEFKQNGNYELCYFSLFNKPIVFKFKVNLSDPFGILFKMVDNTPIEVNSEGELGNEAFFLEFLPSLEFQASLFLNNTLVKDKTLQTGEKIYENGKYRIELFHKDNISNKTIFAFEIFKSEITPSLTNKENQLITHFQIKNEKKVYRHLDKLNLLISELNPSQNFLLKIKKKDLILGSEEPMKIQTFSGNVSLLFLDPASYTVFIIDAFNNKAEICFEIDNTPPNLLFYSRDGLDITNEAIINKESVLTTNKPFYFASGKSFTKFYISFNDGLESEREANLVFYQEGKYKVKVVDDLGLFYVRTIIYQTKKPYPYVLFNNQKKRLINEDDYDYDYTNDLGYLGKPLKTRFHFSLVDLNTLNLLYLTYKKENVEYTKNLTITPFDTLEVNEEGEFEFTLTSVFNNTFTFLLTIDKTAPNFKVKGLNNFNKSSTKVVFSWTEFGATGFIKNIKTKEEKEISSEDAFYKEGEFEFRLTDSVGNYKIKLFSISRKEPEPLNFTNLNEVVSESLFNSKTYLTNKTVFLKDLSLFSEFRFFLNEEKLLGDKEIKEEGKYTFLVISSFDVEASITFIIDLTPPSYEKEGIINQNKANAFVLFTWEEPLVEGYISKNNIDFTEYYKTTRIYEDGSYTFKLVDRAGNEAFYSFSINKETPSALAFTNLTEVVKPNLFNENRFYTNKNVKLNLNNSFNKFFLNSVQIFESLTLTESGEYELKVINDYLNTDLIKFKIIKENPLFTFEGLNENFRSNTFVVFTWLNLGFNGKVKNKQNEEKPIYPGEKFYEKGKFTFILTDEVGNESSLDFEIVSIVPSIILKHTDGTPLTSSYTNKPVIIFGKNDYLTYLVNDTTITTFPHTLTSDGTYVIKASNEFGEEITKTVKIKSQIGLITPSLIERKTNKDISFNFNQEEISLTLSDGTILLSGENYFKEGKTIFYFKDIFGNVSDYEINQSRTLPEIFLIVKSSNGEEKELSLISNITLYEPFKIKPIKGISFFVNASISESQFYEESQDYIIKVLDEFGNEMEYTFTGNFLKSKNTEKFKYNKIMFTVLIITGALCILTLSFIKLFFLNRNPFTRKRVFFTKKKKKTF